MKWLCLNAIINAEFNIWHKNLGGRKSCKSATWASKNGRLWEEEVCWANTESESMSYEVKAFIYFCVTEWKRHNFKIVCKRSITDGLHSNKYLQNRT